MPRVSTEAKARLEAFKTVKVRHARLLETHEQVTQVISGKSKKKRIYK
jgi:hypothetical protein